MTCAFAALKGMHVMQKAKQLETPLIGVLATIQDRTQQAIDALGQHTPAPRTLQGLAQGIPSQPKLVKPQQRECRVQVLFPQPLPRLPFAHGPRVALLIGLDLPHASQRLNRRGAPAVSQGRECCVEERPVAEQRGRPMGEIGMQLLIDAPRPGLQLFARAPQRL